jgi:hypothetical protein
VFPKDRNMLDRESQSFDACLPRLERSIRISSLHDARIFARRWVIRDKDPALEALVRRLDRARSSDAETTALRAFRQALESRSLLPQPRTSRKDG